jgi:phage terminase small subunit
MQWYWRQVRLGKKNKRGLWEAERLVFDNLAAYLATMEAPDWLDERARSFTKKI